MKKLVLGALVVVAIGFAVWLASERGKRGGDRLAPDSKTTALLERKSPHIEPPPAAVERHEIEATGPASEPVVSSSTVELAPESVFHGRVVDALTQRPIAGARLHLGEGPLRFVAGSRTFEPPVRTAGESDARGLVVLRGSDATLRRHALLLADGFAPALLLIEAGHETPERAAWVELLPAPSLEVLTLDSSGLPQAGIAIEIIVLAKSVVDDLEHGLRPPLTVTAHTNALGRARFDDVPAETPLEVRFVRDRIPSATAESLALLAGEQRSIVRTMGLGTVRGRVVDPDGVGVATDVWLTRVGRGPTSSIHSYWTSSRADGTFELPNVLYGTWIAGCAAPLEGRALRGSPWLVDRPEVEIVLHVRRGLTIEGTVLDSAGNPVRDAYVTVTPLEPALGDEIVEVGTEDDGSFRSPSVLRPGLHAVHAVGAEGWTPEVLVESGTTGVELQFQRAAVVHARFRGVEPGAIVRSTVVVEGGHTQVFSVAGDARDFPVNRGASIHVSSGERIAVVPAHSSTVTGEVVLDLEPAAYLTVVNAGSERPRRLRLWHERCLLFDGDLLPGESATRPVPAGAVRAEFLDGTNVLAGETVTLAPRERRRITLAPE